MTDITVIILTKNEEKNIERCITSIKQIADRICVIDSGSSDMTRELATNLGAEVVIHDFITHGQQFNWAVDNLNINTKWILRLDADEVVTDELAKEIVVKCNTHANDDVNGFVMKFKVFFLDRFLKHGGMYPFVKMTLFKYGKGRFDESGMRDHIILSEGQSIILENDCLHYDFKNLEAWINKHNWYSSLEVENLCSDHALTQDGTGREKKAENVRKVRDGVYYKLPKYFRAKLYFWFKFYLQLGFLDGEAGRIHAFLQAYWYRYLIDAKLYEQNIIQNNRGYMDDKKE